MEHATGTLLSGDGLELFTQSWRPASPRGAVVLAHGYAEHSARYAALAYFLAGHSFAVHAIDHRGHGKSAGERANVTVFRAYVNDLERFVEQVRQEQPELPYFLLGHSVGALVASQFALERPHLLAGLILSSPYLKNAASVSPILLRLSGLVSRLLPSLPTVKLDTRLLSRDPEAVSAYTSDPLVYTGGAKARLGSEMLKAGADVLARAGDLQPPLLIVHGLADGVADPEGSRLLYERSGSADKMLKLYEGGYHELFNDLERVQVMDDVLAWLETCLGNRDRVGTSTT